MLRAEGQEREALGAAQQLLNELLESRRPDDQPVKIAFAQALDAALALGEREQDNSC